MKPDQSGEGEAGSARFGVQYPLSQIERFACGDISCNGLVVGIASEISMAWSAAKHFHDGGAELALTYYRDKAKPFVAPLAETISAPRFFCPATCRCRAFYPQKLRHVPAVSI